MIFSPTSLQGVIEITIERHSDERGSFGRVFCEREFASAGLPTRFAQWSASVNRHAGTLRGMHWQAPPFSESKLVRCVRGAIYDVVADLRPSGSGPRRWQAFRLDPSKDVMLFIPPGFAHGFQTLEDDSEVLYAMDTFFVPDHSAGFRYDDVAFNIEWPLQVTSVAAKDLAWPPFLSSGHDLQ